MTIIQVSLYGIFLLINLRHNTREVESKISLLLYTTDMGAIINES